LLGADFIDWEMPKNTSAPSSRLNRKAYATASMFLLALIKLQHRYDQITRISDLPRFKDPVNYAQSSILIASLRGIIIGMRLQLAYSRLDRNVRERVLGSTENHGLV
jgi:hypothetical protein